MLNQRETSGNAGKIISFFSIVQKATPSMRSVLHIDLRRRKESNQIISVDITGVNWATPSVTSAFHAFRTVFLIIDLLYWGTLPILPTIPGLYARRGRQCFSAVLKRRVHCYCLSSQIRTLNFLKVHKVDPRNHSTQIVHFFVRLLRSVEWYTAWVSNQHHSTHLVRVWASLQCLGAAAWAVHRTCCSCLSLLLCAEHGRRPMMK